MSNPMHDDDSVDPLTAASLRVRATSKSNRTIAGHVASLKEKCSQAADRGMLSVSIEFDGRATVAVPYEIRDTVKKILESEGFKVSYYEGDQRDPCSGINVAW